MRPFVTFILTLNLLMLGMLAGCGKTDSPEQQVRNVIDQMEAAAEARDVGDLSKHISNEYRDANGMTARDAGRYMRGYFMANQSIHLVTRIEHIEFPFPEEARVQLLVGTLDNNADLRQFKVTFRLEDGDWKVTFAEWSQ